MEFFLEGYFFGRELLFFVFLGNCVVLEVKLSEFSEIGRVHQQ